jgi:2,3-bisphosphoglycerate-dependent phosphoglycerate mutase
MEEATKAGVLLHEGGFVFDRVFTSVLKRAIHTAWIVMDEIDQAWLPIEKAWRINERHYGVLQGINKVEVVAEFGEEQAWEWRRGYKARPSAITEYDSRNPAFDLRYSGLNSNEIPFSESLEDVQKRTVGYWKTHIAPFILEGENILIVAHGNTFRALVMYFDGMSEEEIKNLSIPTGIPLVYDLDEDLKALKRRYLGDPEAATRAAEAVARQSKIDMKGDQPTK